jgi:hypothetical protein
VSQFKYSATTVTNRNLIQEEIKRRLNSGNACYHSVQNFLSSRLLSKNIRIIIMYKNCILPLVLHGWDRLCGLVVRVLGYRSGGPRFKKKKTVVGLERGPLSLVSTTEELLDRKVAAPV